MKVNAKDIIGENAISMQSGKNLYEKISKPLISGEEVELDFAGVQIFASPFFNASIGFLLKDIDISQLQDKLKILNLGDVGNQILNLVISNAIKFYDKKSSTADILNSIDIDPEEK